MLDRLSFDWALIHFLFELLDLKVKHGFLPLGQVIEFMHFVLPVVDVLVPNYNVYLTSEDEIEGLLAVICVDNGLPLLHISNCETLDEL